MHACVYVCAALFQYILFHLEKQPTAHPEGGLASESLASDVSQPSGSTNQLGRTSSLPSRVAKSHVPTCFKLKDFVQKMKKCLDRICPTQPGKAVAQRKLLLVRGVGGGGSGCV